MSTIKDNYQQLLHVLDYGKPDNIRNNRQRYATIIACAGYGKPDNIRHNRRRYA